MDQIDEGKHGGELFVAMQFGVVFQFCGDIENYQSKLAIKKREGGTSNLPEPPSYMRNRRDGSSLCRPVVYRDGIWVWMKNGKAISPSPLAMVEVVDIVTEELFDEESVEWASMEDDSLL